MWVRGEAEISLDAEVWDQVGLWVTPKKSNFAGTRMNIAQEKVLAFIFGCFLVASSCCRALSSCSLSYMEWRFWLFQRFWGTAVCSAGVYMLEGLQMPRLGLSPSLPQELGIFCRHCSQATYSDQFDSRNIYEAWFSARASSFMWGGQWVLG